MTTKLLLATYHIRAMVAMVCYETDLVVCIKVVQT